MKKILTLTILLFAITNSYAQIMRLTVEPDGGNRKASVSEQIGIMKIDISYNRPGVKAREGKIWNTPVAHYGFIDLGHGTTNAAPWRAGANENTVISFSHAVRIEGRDLPAGSYGFFIALGEEESTLIFNKINTSWGSFYYDSTQDALRVKVKNRSSDKMIEWLKYEFIEQGENTATVALSWEKRMIPFKIEVDRKKIQIDAFTNDFRTTRPYYDFITAALWCVDNNYALEQALAWMERAIYLRVMGEKNYRTLNTKARVLFKMNRTEDAKKVMVEALPLGTMSDVHFYGRQLLTMNDKEEAFNVFKANYDKYPDQYTTRVGMGRIYSAKADYKTALTHMEAALKLAADDVARANVQAQIEKLKAGKDIN